MNNSHWVYAAFGTDTHICGRAYHGSYNWTEIQQRKSIALASHKHRCFPGDVFNYGRWNFLLKYKVFRFPRLSIGWLINRVQQTWGPSEVFRTFSSWFFFIFGVWFLFIYLFIYFAFQFQRNIISIITLRWERNRFFEVNCFGFRPCLLLVIWWSEEVLITRH